MSKKYVTRIYVDINGQTIEAFNHFEEEAVTSAKAVPLMFSTGYAQMTKRFKVNLDYVRPAVNPIDWMTYPEEVAIHVVRDGGEETIWTGCTVESVGALTYNGETEAVEKITFICESRDGDRGDGNA